MKAVLMPYMWIEIFFSNTISQYVHTDSHVPELSSRRSAFTQSSACVSEKRSHYLRYLLWRDEPQGVRLDAKRIRNFKWKNYDRNSLMKRTLMNYLKLASVSSP